MFDATIIGGGPAGSVTAIVLARAGLRVCQIEQSRFPRDKVCGECVSSLGIQVLEKLELAGLLQQAGAKIFRRAVLHAPGGSKLEINLPRAMWGISRVAMDEILLKAAAEAGVVVRQPVRCERIGHQGQIGPGDHRAIQARDLADNSLHTIESKWLIVADGKGSLLDRKPKATGDLGIKAHFESVDGAEDCIELFGLNGHYGGLAAIENGRWNAAFSVPATRVAESRGDLDRLMAGVIAENPALVARLGGARLASRWLASPLPRFGVSGTWPRGIIPIGNAAAAIEPIGGEGMGLAMWSGLSAARAIIENFDGRERLERELRSKFTGMWHNRRAACRAMAMLLARPHLAEIMVAAGASAPAWSAGVLGWMGKGMSGAMEPV